MRFSLLVLSLIAVFAPLHVHGKSSDESGSDDGNIDESSSDGGSSDEDVIDKCFADLKTKNPCQNNPKSRRIHFFNKTTCQCDDSNVCLKGANSFKDGLTCRSVCVDGLVGNGIPGDWGTWSPCSATCGECTQTRERSCTKDNPDNTCSCEGILVLETQSVQQDSCETVLYRLNAGGDRTNNLNGWLTGVGTTDDTACANTACALNYRNPAVDDWVGLGASHIVITLLKDGAVAHYIRFSATGTNQQSWFSGPRVVSSSWPSLVGSSAPAYIQVSAFPFLILLADCNPRIPGSTAKFYLVVTDFVDSRCQVQFIDPPAITYHLANTEPVSSTAATLGLADAMLITATF